VEVRLDNSLSGSLQEKRIAELATRAEHQIISLSVVSAGEYNMYLRAFVVIEYLAAERA
jgi:hypothetical protein